VLSQMPELLSCWMAAADAAVLLRHVNEEIARMVATDPARFHGLGAVPLQDMDLALRELEHAVRGLGLAGVEIPGNVDGIVIGDARFDPLWEACVALDACVFVHPLRPAGMDRLVGPKALQQVLAFPTESGLAAASLLTGGVLERHPGLRIAFSHGAGTLPSLLPRLQHGWMRTPAVRETMGTAPAELARRLYVDSLVYDPRTLRLLVDLFGPTQVLVGSDYPFNIREHEPVQRILEAGLPPAQVELLLSRNARRWLGLDPP
jgi:aminocarboxymuconate-semialdehyde decarboxylase